jgi:unsaturated rhamnogalacturonyl hydrolase
MAAISASATPSSSAAAQTVATYRGWLASVTMAAACLLCAGCRTTESWPQGSSPTEVGRRVAERFIATPHPNFGSPQPPTEITYPETCAWYGALTFAKLAGETNLSHELIARFEPLLGEEKKMIPRPNHVDASVFGAVPLEIYIQTRDARYLALGKTMADKQWATPTNPAALSDAARNHLQRGLSPQTRFWIDDMYMITALQAQAFRATGVTNYLNRAALEMVAYLDELQQPNGLFYHAPDVPFFWGRGNGWMAAGMSELLRSLPANHPEFPRVLAGYKQMMATLLRYQGADGMWRQLIDQPESWPESSCTGMFTFAFITGVKNGWLDEKSHGEAARKGWLALVARLDTNADLHGICEGTNKKNSQEYYLNRKQLTGDMHGQAPVLWCASAWLRPAR